MELVANVKGCIVVEIFVEHNVDISEVVDFCDEGPLVNDLRNDEGGDSADVEEVIIEEVRSDGEKEPENNDGETFADVNNEGVNNEGEKGDASYAENEGNNGAKAKEVMEDAENEGITEVINEDVGKEGNAKVPNDEDGYVSEEDEDYVGTEEENEYDTDFDIGVDGEEEWD